MSGIKWLCFSTIFLTLCLITLGGVVHNTGSSLACPDWPTCYGTFFPRMEGGILIEHGHRLLASLVGFLSILLVFFTRKTKKLFSLSALALALVILQGLLGGLTVIQELPTIVSTFHVAFSLIFLIFLWKIFFETCPLPPKPPSWSPLVFHLFLTSLGFLFFQILLGAFLRHSGAGASCGVGPEFALWCEDLSSQEAKLHFVHRLLGVGVLGMVLGSALLMNRFLRGGWRLLNLLAPLFLFFQAITGVLTVSSSFALIPTTLHLTMASLALSCMVLVAFLGKKIQEKSPNPHSFLSDVTSFIRPRLTLLVMVSSLAGLLLASSPEGGGISFFKALLGLTSIALVVVGAGALNCLIDLNVDKAMTRTKERPLPSGRLSPKVPLILGGLSSGVGVTLLTVFFGMLVGGLALLSLFSYVALYTPMKTKSPLALLIGAFPGALPPVLGSLLVSESFNIPVLALFFIIFLWQFPHFLSIGLFHQDDYDKAGVETYTARLPFKKSKQVVLFFTLLVVLLSVFPWWAGQASFLYLLVALILGLFFFLSGIFPSSSKKQWARRYFYASITYLPLVMFSLVLLR